MRVTSDVPEPAEVAAMVELARRIFKREWTATKLGPVAKPWMWVGEKLGAKYD